MSSNTSTAISRSSLSHETTFESPAPKRMRAGSTSSTGGRKRSNSITGRLRSCSDLADTGVLSDAQKSFLKDLIVSRDPRIENAFRQYDKTRNPKFLHMLLERGRGNSLDLLESELDLNLLHVDDSYDGKGHSHHEVFHFDEDGANFAVQTAPNGAIKFQYDFLDDHHMGEHGVGRSHSFSLDEHSASSAATLPSSFDHRKYSTGGVDGNSSANAPAVSSASHAHHRHRSTGGSIGSISALNALLRVHSDTRTSFDETVNNVLQHAGSMDYDIASQQVLHSLSATAEHDGALAHLQEDPSAALAKALLEEPISVGSFYPPHSHSRTSVDESDQDGGNEEEDESKGFGVTTRSTRNSNGLDRSKKVPVKARPSNRSKPKSSSSSNKNKKKEDEGTSEAPIVNRLAQMPSPEQARREGYIGAYDPEARKERIARFMEKRKRRVWTKKVKYDVRKSFADSRLRVKGRFVKKEDEELLREYIQLM